MPDTPAGSQQTFHTLHCIALPMASSYACYAMQCQAHGIIWPQCVLLFLTLITIPEGSEKERSILIKEACHTRPSLFCERLDANGGQETPLSYY